jgi:adenine-specific DNA-methyltransferase
VYRQDAAVTTKPKLELTWIGKENRPRLEPRILLEDSTRSHHAAHRVTNHDLFENRRSVSHSCT